MGEVRRNLQEQVLYLTEKVKEIMQSLGRALPSPIAGPQGPAGPRGETGPQGEEGYGIKGFGTQLPASGRNGDWWLVQQQDEGGTNIYAYKRVNYHWVRQFSLRGPQGVPGTQGGSEVIANPENEAVDRLSTIEIDGVTYFIEGEVGPEGPQGEVGPAGPQGPQGPAGVVNVDTLYNATEGSSTINVDYNETNDKITFRVDDSLIEDIDSAMSAVEEVEALVPAEASVQNKLADKAFVNSSIATNTANFLGTYDYSDIDVSITERDPDVIAEALADAVEGTPTRNDYTFYEVKSSISSGEETIGYERYKWNGTRWEFEYELNNSSFTASQWATINSGLTADSVNGKLDKVTSTASYERVYGIGTNGNQTTIAAMPSANAGSIVKRDGAGRFQCSGPLAQNDVTHKGYVDSSIGSWVLTFWQDGEKIGRIEPGSTDDLNIYIPSSGGGGGSTLYEHNIQITNSTGEKKYIEFHFINKTSTPVQNFNDLKTHLTNAGYVISNNVAHNFLPVIGHGYNNTFGDVGIVGIAADASTTTGLPGLIVGICICRLVSGTLQYIPCSINLDNTLSTIKPTANATWTVISDTVRTL